MGATGDVERFYEWVWPHRALVLRSAQALVPASDVDDLAQETLLRAFSAIGRFTPGKGAGAGGAGVKAWLLKILRNVHLDRLRAAGSRVKAGPLPEEVVDHREGSADYGGDPRAVLEAFSDAQVIEALLRLPEDMRWTLLLSDVEGMDLKEVAEVMDIAVGTAKSRVSRARSELRKTLLPVAKGAGRVGLVGGVEGSGR